MTAARYAAIAAALLLLAACNPVCGVSTHDRLGLHGEHVGGSWKCDKYQSLGG